MIKVAMIGAGSVVFSKNLTGDILGFPEFRDATFCYMDIDAQRLEVGASLCRKVAKTLGANPTIQATQDRRQALAGADFVINMVQIGGFDSTLVDFEIPRKYGLNFTIADTTGPGGLFRALRTFPMLRGLCRDMTELCPAATLLNYSNPMSMNMQTISRAGEGVRAVGLCHSVQGTFDQLMRYIDEDPAAIAFICAGINHMAFYLRIEKDGVDLYPRLFEAMNKPDIYATNKVRFELMKRLGRYITESSEHNAEYSPWFIPRGSETIARFGVPIDEYLRRCDGIVDEFQRMRALCKSDEPMAVHRSHEYGSTIIHSIVTGKPSVVYGNMPNRGAIANLPATAIAEAPTLVDRAGLQFTTVGELPPQLVGYMQPHITQHELFIRAAMEGRRDHVYQAAMFDPLTAATLTLDQIVQMCDELIAAHGDLLPRLDARTLVPSSGLTFGPVNPSDLRKSWDAEKAKAAQDAIINWHIIGPFKSEAPGQISLDFMTPVEELFIRAGGSARRDDVDRADADRGTFTAAHAGPSVTQAGAKSARPSAAPAAHAIHASAATADRASGASAADRPRANAASPAIDLHASFDFAGQSLAWRPVTADKRGFVNLSAHLGKSEWSVAYAYAQIESIHARDAILRCGSDDGIRIWLNGQIVHENETGRAYTPNQDQAPIHLIAGVNRLLVKIDNYRGGWGLGVSIPKANF